MGNENATWGMTGTFDFSGLDNLQFTPEQVDQINQQATDDVQNFLESDNYKEQVDFQQSQPPPEPVTPENVIDPNIDPDLMLQISAELGKAYGGSGYDPSFADVNAGFLGTQYHQTTAFDLLNGKYYHISSVGNRKLRTFFVFDYHGIIYFTLKENKYIFDQTGYTFLKATDGMTYAIEPCKQPSDLFPGVRFPVLPGAALPSDESKCIKKGNNRNPLDNTPSDKITPPPPVDENGDPSWLVYAPLLLVGAAILGLARGK